MREEPFAVIVAEFPEEKAAQQALNKLQAERKDKSFDLIDAAIIRKTPDGKLHIKETNDSGGGKGAATGLLAGAAIGLIGGPLGIAAWSASGALLGGIAARLHDRGIHNDQLRQVGQELTPGSSALVVVIDSNWTTPIEKELVEAGGRVFTTEIAAEIAAQLRKDAQDKQSETDSFIPVSSSGVLQSPAMVEQQARDQLEDE